MANPIFPTLSTGQDSKLYSVKRENPATGTSMEGGYVVTRAKHTRIPRKTYTTGFSFITDVDRVILDTFWDTVRGGSVIFDWTDPVTNTVIPVRFAQKDELTFKYVGIGYNKRWDVQFTLEQA